MGGYRNNNNNNNGYSNHRNNHNSNNNNGFNNMRYNNNNNGNINNNKHHRDGGSMNSGSMNSGSMNSGSMNNGSMNSGSMNSGSMNSGMGGMGGGHNNHNNNHHMNNQNNNSSFNNANNMLNNKDLAPRFKRTLVPAPQSSVEDLQMRPAQNSLLSKAMNIKPNQLPLHTQSPQTRTMSGGGFGSTSSFQQQSNVDNLISPFSGSSSPLTTNGNKHGSLSPNQLQKSQGLSQQQHFTTAASKAGGYQTNGNGKSPLINSQQSSSNTQSPKDQTLVTKQGSIEKPGKAKKDKGPSREEVLKTVSQFITETLLDKTFIENHQLARQKKDEIVTIIVEDKKPEMNGVAIESVDAVEVVTDEVTINGHTNGNVEIIEDLAEEDEKVKTEKVDAVEEVEKVEVPEKECEEVQETPEDVVMSMEGAIKIFDDLKVPDKFLKDAITKIVNESLDQGDSVHEVVIDFLQLMRKEGKLQYSQLVEAYRGVINGMSEREKTIPKVTTLVASMLSRAINMKICKLSDVANFANNGQYYPLLLLVLQQQHKSIGKDKLIEVFNASKINLMNTLPEADRTKDRMAEILDDRKLNFLAPLLRIESELWKQIQADAQPQTFYKWIKENVDSQRYTDPGFITALMTVLLRFITQVSCLLVYEWSFLLIYFLIIAGNNFP